MTDIFSSVERLSEVNVRAKLGPYFRHLRESLFLTQNDISDATGFSVQTISKIENGKLPSLGAVSIHELVSYFCEMNEITEREFIDGFCLYCESYD